MAEAVALAALHGADAVDQALATAAMVGRFAEGDLESIIVQASGSSGSVLGPPSGHSLAAGTSMWSSLGTGAEEDQR